MIFYRLFDVCRPFSMQRMYEDHFAIRNKRDRRTRQSRERRLSNMIRNGFLWYVGYWNVELFMAGVAKLYCVPRV